MKIQISYPVTALMLVSFLSAASASADDVEIYSGENATQGANVVFLVDTSASMERDAIMAVRRPAYDSSYTYPTEYYGFDPEGYYVFREDTFSDDQLEVNLTSAQVALIKEYQVAESSVVCDDNTFSAIERRGYSRDRFAFWQPGTGWTAPQYDSDMLASDRPTVSQGAGTILQCRQFGYRPYEYNGAEYEHLTPPGATFPYTTSYVFSERWDWGNGRYNDGQYDILWSGNYLNYLGTPLASEEVTRLELVKTVAKEVVATTQIKGLNLGLMRFEADGHGAFVNIPVTPITEVVDDFNYHIDSWATDSTTPMSEALWEAWRYLSGRSVDFGLDSRSTIFDERGREDEIDFPSVPASRMDSNQAFYKAPDFPQCSIATKVVLFSDGDPTGDSERNDEIDDLVRYMNLPAKDYYDDDWGRGYDCGGSGDCVEEMAYYMNNVDHRSDVRGTQTITIDTIGGFINDDRDAIEVLSNIAEAGGGTFTPVETYSEISDALKEAFLAPIDVPSSFTSPTISVNSFNSLEKSDEVYFSVFAPHETQNWKGNLKRYRMRSDGTIEDQNGFAAVDPDSGYFADNAQSFWSETPDGATVNSGGAASRLTSPRKVFTTVNGSIEKLAAPTGVPANSVIGNIPASVKTVLTDELLGLGVVESLTSSLRDEVIGWVLGYNSDGSVRTEIEDPLHSQPLVINYGPDDSVAFIATNSGYLHAFSTDVENPQEYFSLIPRELLQNPYQYFKGERYLSGEKVYGLDGAVTHWHNDTNYNGIVDGTDKVYLFVGMRRGGQSYYALDVTDRNDPQMLWEVHGNYVDDELINVPEVTSGFSELGQTWGSLIPAMVRYQGADKVVLFASGGYDPDEDGDDLNGPLTRSGNSIGRTVYMIDALTGEKLWSALSDVGLESEMLSAFAADVIPVDRNDNGYIDLLYAADVGGRVWRFDLSESAENAATFATGGVIADINTSDAQGNRRFFSSPDITYYNDYGSGYVLISIGSGYRAHPLSQTTTDYQFLIKDLIGKQYPEGYSSVSFGDLEEWGTSDAQTAAHGWYIPLTDAYEKVLATSVTVKGLVSFTTYTPNDASSITAQCGTLGTSRLYMADVRDPMGTNLASRMGVPPAQIDDGRYVIETVKTGIPPSPVVLMPEAAQDPDNPDELICGEGLTLVGPEAFRNGLNRCDMIERIFWKEND